MIKDEIRAVLKNDADLIESLGGLSENNQRVYTDFSPNAVEFPRVLITELFCDDDINGDNESGFERLKIRLTVYSKSKDYFSISRKIKKILKQNYFMSTVSLGGDAFERDTKVYSKTVDVELLIESED